MKFIPAEMRARFADLSEQRDKIRAKADPIRAARDELVAAQLAELAKADDKVRAAEDGLFDIDQERAMLVRALGGKTLAPEDVEAAEG